MYYLYVNDGVFFLKLEKKNLIGNFFVGGGGVIIELFVSYLRIFIFYYRNDIVIFCIKLLMVLFFNKVKFFGIYRFKR